MSQAGSSPSMSLDEFQRISNLPDQAIMALIRQKALPLELSSTQELRVRLDKLDRESMRRTLLSMSSDFEAQWGAILEERCSFILGQEFNSMVSLLLEKSRPIPTSESSK